MHAQIEEGCMGLATKAEVYGTIDVPKVDSVGIPKKAVVVVRL